MKPVETDFLTVAQVVREALELPADQRAGWLGARCPHSGQYAAAERLLRACDLAAASPLLHSPAAQFAAPLLAEALGRERPVPESLRAALAGRYDIQKEVGRGGQATVFLARDERHGRLVALKVLDPWLVVDDGPSRWTARFRREIRLAARLSHPHILPLYDSGAAAGHLYYVMPYVDGESLRRRLARSGRLPLPETIRVLRDVTRALAYAHRHGVIHRDIKTANVLLTADGDALVSDFGVAKAIAVAASGVDGQDADITGTELILGTPAYMAPEQANSEPNIDHRADLYSLGVVAYELLTGATPFQGSSRLDVLVAVLSDTPVPVASGDPHVPASLARLVDRLLARRPEHRPRDAAEVLSVLDALAASPAGGSPPDGSSSHWRPADGGAEAPAAPAAAAGLEKPWTWRGASTPRGRRAWLGVASLALAAGAAGLTAWLQRPRAAAGPAAPVVVAVLPFEDLDARDDSVYLGVALAAEIASQLSRLNAISVPSEWSTLAYRGSRTLPEEIARRLRANVIVRGSVRRSGGEVRLAIALFDARRGGRVWTREYGAPLTALPALTRGVTGAIVAALRVTPTAIERTAMRRLPTSSGYAYDLYLRGRAAQSGALPDDFGPPQIDRLRRAESYFASAREADPDFAVARARLALSLLALAPFDRSSARTDQGRLEAEAALEHEPGMPEAHEALASYWTLVHDLPRATSQLELALAGRPNDSHLYGHLGANLRESGRWQESLRAFERASRLDPGNVAVHTQAAVTYSRVRRYDEAIAHWDRVIAEDRSWNAFARLIRGQAYLRMGNVDSLEASVSRVPLGMDAGGMTTYSHFTVHQIRRRYAEALALLDSARFAISADQLMYRPVSLLRAQTLERMGDQAGARASFRIAKALLEDSAAVHPRDPRIRVALGLAYAGLGRHEDAVHEARTAIELAPVSASSPMATACMGGAVEIYAELGDATTALDLIELLLAMPAGREISIPLLRLDPAFDPLRNNPRFDALINRSSRN